MRGSKLGRRLLKFGNGFVDAFINSMESTISPRDMFGSPLYRVSAGDHLATRSARLAQIRNGRWELIGELDARQSGARRPEPEGSAVPPHRLFYTPPPRCTIS